MGWLNVGLRILPLILNAVGATETFFKGKKSGAAKEDAAVNMVHGWVSTVETASGNHALLKDENVDAAVRDVMRSICSLQKVIATAGTRDDDE